MYVSDRVSTGIPHLDVALQGGIPINSLVLISGGAGTGKSTFCLQYLLDGAKNGEAGLYITTEQNEVELNRQTAAYGISLSEMIEKNAIKVLFVDILKEENAIPTISSAISDFRPKRLVLDSLTTFSEYAAISDYAKDILLKRGGIAVRSIDQVAPKKISDRTMIKRMLASLLNELRRSNATILMTSEIPFKGNALSSDGISEFLADGVITLHYLGIGSARFRTMQIRKMRYTGHELEPLSYEIVKTGMNIVIEKPFR